MRPRLVIQTSTAWLRELGGAGAPMYLEEALRWAGPAQVADPRVWLQTK